MFRSLRWRSQQPQSASAWAMILAFVLGSSLDAQIPDAPGEITFAQVETAAGLADMRTAQSTVLEARLMSRSWSPMLPMTPVPFLRIFQADGAVRGQMFVYWAPRLAPGRQPETSDRCRAGICVRPIEITQPPNWEEVLAALVREDACPTTTPPEVVSVCSDCPELWIRTTATGKYREQSCSDPRVGTRAGSLLQLMNTAARAATAR